jgi:F1F0 ATPase subunit 2
MIFPSFNALPAWAEVVSLVTHLGAGIVLGILHFRGLWWSVRRFFDGGNLVATIALMIGRFVLLGGLMTLASLEGALPLLVLALGVLAARAAVIRRVREVTP